MKKLCILVALMLLCASAVAETPATPIHRSGDYIYVIAEDGSAEIVSWDGADERLEVPGALDGLTVTGVGECAFSEREGLKAVALPDTVRAIGQEAFANCVDLVEIELPEGLESVGDLAFDSCEGLTAVSLPDTVRDLGDNPFRNCANLYDIRVSGDHAYLAVTDGVLFTRPDERLVCFPSGRSDARYAVPEGVRAIGAMAFDRDLYLEEVVLPASLVTIGRRAFDGCDGLLSMNLPAGVTSIGEDAMRCAALRLTVEDEGGAVQLVEAVDFRLDEA